MAKRCIGIDIGSTYIRAVQIARRTDQFCVEKIFGTQTRRSTDSLPAIIRSLIDEHGFDRHAEIAISMPQESVFFREIEFDRADNEKILEQNFSALQYNFPIEVNDMIAQLYSYKQISNDRYSALAVAASKNSFRQTMQLLSTARMQPKLVEAAAFALHAAVAINQPEIKTGTAVLAHIDESHLILSVIKDNEISIVRNIPLRLQFNEGANSTYEQVAELFIDEIRNTWRKIFVNEQHKDCDIYLIAPDDALNYLRANTEEDLNARIITVNPYANMQCVNNYKPKFPISIPAGLALRCLASEQTKGINFLMAGHSDVRATFNVKKELTTCIILGGIIIVIWLIGLFIQLSYMEADYAGIKAKMNNIFRQIVPEENNIVNPLAQLHNKLDTFQKNHGFSNYINSIDQSPLRVLHSISTQIPPDSNLKVDDLLITTDSVRISGSCESFESMHDLQMVLKKMPDLALVDVPDIQKEPKTGRIHFTILLASKHTEYR